MSDLRDLARTLPAVADEIAAEYRNLTLVLDLRRILRERDEDLRYLHQHAADDTHRSPGALSCGCEAGKDCKYHADVQAALEEAEES